MGNKLYEENSISAIASAIRNKLGTDAQYRVGDMSAAIASIPTGVTPTGTLKIATNGTYDVTNYASAEVAIQPKLGTKNIFDDGTYTASSDNLDGYSSLLVQVMNAYDAQIPPYWFDMSNGFVEATADKYKRRDSEEGKSYCDVYKIKENRKYLIIYGDPVGNKQRIGYCAIDPHNMVDGEDYDLTYVKRNNSTSITGYNAIFTAEYDGFLICYKSDQYESGYKTYLLDLDMVAPQQTGTINITQNMTGLDISGYGKANINVQPTGTLNIDTNGTYDVRSYASAVVATPVPTGKKTVIANGTDIDIAQYATLDVIVPSSATGTIEIESDALEKTVDVSSYQYAHVINPWLSIMSHDVLQIGKSDTTSITFNYDNTREIETVMVSPIYVTTGSYAMISCFYKYSDYDQTSMIQCQTFINNNGTAEAIANSTNAGAITIDSTAGTVTINSRGSNYKYRAGSIFAVIIMYKYTSPTNQNG